EYGEALQEVQDELVDDLSRLPKSQRALVTCEGAFSYLARDAELNEKYIWPVNAESQATPGQITSAIDFVQDNEVPAVFCGSTRPPTPNSAAPSTSIRSRTPTARSRPTSTSSATMRRPSPPH